MKIRRTASVAFIAMLLMGLMAVPTAAQTPTCKDFADYKENLTGDTSGDWGSITFTPDDGPLILVVNEGWEVDLCLKKATDPIHAPGNPYGEGTHEVHYPGTEDGFSHYDFIAREIENGDEPNGTPTTTTESTGIRLVKLWFDADGDQASAPDGDWTVVLSTGGGPQATVASGTGAQWASLNTGASYSVSEDDLPGGWSEAACGDFDLPDIGTDYLDSSGTGTGFSADEEGAHAVCNQAAEVEVLAEVIEAEEEEVEVLAELPRTGLATLLLALMGAAAIGTGSVMVRSRR